MSWEKNSYLHMKDCICIHQIRGSYIYNIIIIRTATISYDPQFPMLHFFRSSISDNACRKTSSRRIQSLT